MTSIIRPLCMDCKHLNDTECGFSCKAFPDGIPDDIFSSTILHIKPYKGDKGIQFEPRDGITAEEAIKYVKDMLP